jgi:hypothetical protein
MVRLACFEVVLSRQVTPQHLSDWHEGSLGQSQEVKLNCCYDIKGMTNPFYLQLAI